MSPRGRAAEIPPQEGGRDPVDSGEEDLITRIAWLYYLQKMTQAQIADQLSLSRQRVQRLLERARDLEIIRFTLKHPHSNLLGIEARMKERLGLQDAVVVPNVTTSKDQLRQAFAKAGASYLERRLGAMRNYTLGIGWGNTTAYLADFFESQQAGGKVEVVSLIGNLMLNVSMNPYLMGEKIARKLGAPFYNIWAPAIAQTKDSAEVFKAEPWINRVLDIGRRSDVILISIGEASRSASLFRMGYLPATDLQRLINKGAVGDILSRFFDAEGRVIDDEVHDRVVSVPLETLLERKKLVIGVAGGASKVPAIRAALKKRYINVLITDERTADELLRGSP